MAVNSGRTVVVKVSTDNANHVYDSASWTSIGQQRGGAAERTTDVADATHKGTTGSWATSISTRRGWSLSVDGVLDVSDQGWALLYAAWNSVDSEWFLLDGSTMSGVSHPEPSVVGSGTAFITSLSFDFPEADIVSYSAELQGTGALAAPAE